MRKPSGPEILLLAGAPWSGKSTLANKFIEMTGPEHTRHVSVGDLKRSIVAGETPSRYADVLRSGLQSERKIGSALGEFRTGIQDQVIPASQAMTGIIEEFILSQPGSLTVVDGFPRYRNGIRPFQDSMRNIGARVLGLCIVSTEHTVLLERSQERPTRAHQDAALTGENYVEQRLADHFRNVMPTLGILATEYPTLIIDGLLPLDVKAAKMVSLYKQFTANTDTSRLA